MSKRGIAALIVGMSLLSAIGLLALVGLAKVAVKRIDARRAEEQARVRADLDRVLEREREAGRAEATAAFTDPKPPTAEEAAEFVTVLNNFGRTLQKEDGPALARLLDPDRMFDELLRIGAFDKVGAQTGPANREAFVRGFREGGGKAVFNTLFRWQSTNVRRVRWSADRKEVVVIATHVNDSELIGRVKLKVRWWLVARADGWHVYDFEELDQGLRITGVLGSFLVPDVLPRLPEVRGALVAIRDAQVAIAQHDLEGAEEAMNRCRRIALPDPLAAVVYLLEGILRFQQGDPAAAHEFIDRALRLRPDMPVADYLRANCYLATGENEKALASADAYVTQLGTDDEVELIRGAAFEGMNRLPEAKAAYRRAHDLDPDSAAALLVLRRVLAPAEVKELGERLTRATDPRKMYDEVFRESRQEPNPFADDALLDALRKARPNDARALGDDIRRKVKAEQFAEAKKLMQQGLKADARADREQVLDAYLFAMSYAKKALGAYADVPKDHAERAFRTLADELDGGYPDDEENQRAPLADLKQLVAAHRKRAPNDPWIWYYQGAIHQHEKEYEKAATAFATGAARLPKVVVNDPDGEEGADDASRFRWRRVDCLFSAKKGLEAYEKVEPAPAVFQQLAGLYDRAEDLDGLAALLAAHRKREPNDIQRVYWQAHLSYRKQDYATATLLFKKFVLETDEKAMNRWSAREEYIRATLRTTPADAGKVLTELGADKVSHALRAAVAAATGDRAELERLLLETTKNVGKVWFYSDEDFRGAINQDRWRDLRTKYPDPNPPPKLEG